MPTPSNLQPVTLYTDGACLGNPGPGGYGALLIAGDARNEISAGYRLTTNNRMEIMAVIAGLRALRQPSRVAVISDSKYVVEAMTKGWVRGWRARGWKKGDGAPALNADLWEELWQLTQRHQVTFEWVKGHAGEAGNERVDRLSVAAAKGPHLLEDTGYLTGGAPPPPGRTASGHQLTAARQQSLLPFDGESAGESVTAPITGTSRRTSAPVASPACAKPLEPAAAFAGKPDNRVAEVRAGAGFLTLTFRDERELRIPLSWYPALASASPADRAEYTLADNGRAVHFPHLGVEVSIATVLGLESPRES